MRAETDQWIVQRRCDLRLGVMIQQRREIARRHFSADGFDRRPLGREQKIVLGRLALALEPRAEAGNRRECGEYSKTRQLGCQRVDNAFDQKVPKTDPSEAALAVRD